MSTDRQKGKIIFSCNSCEDTFESGTGNFQDAYAEAQGEGWTAKKIGNEWHHGCAQCGVPKG